MILLLSSSSDTNLDFVIEWLTFYGHPYLRLNADDPLHDAFHLALNPPEPPRLMVRGAEVELSAIGAVWLRQFGNLRRSRYWFDAKNRVRPDALEQISREQSILLGGLLSLLSGKHWLTHPSRTHVNKLDMLVQAGRAGLVVPQTHVINRKSDLRALIERGDYICKSLYEPMFLKDGSGFYAMFTTKVTHEDLELLDDELAPSLVQRLVPKEYELRVFYLAGQCYSMAIFSQQRARSALDFRNVDWTDPPRQVPYELPPEIAEAVHRFMTGIGLNCGSLDLIKAQDGKYYFLEVNPAGQFGMVAFPCNYPLYEKIALHLIEHDKS
ncbi:MAG: grasp-with-spasm system ATP-grasp peptide maturase [Myxococcales bacterium]|nr:grasp-with-spasm system ATP-grasp peptide maturase [Myxococcales bacterium]